MLILALKQSQKIVATLPDGRVVEVWIHSVRGSHVRLAIDAPPEIPVHRGGVQEKIDAGIEYDKSIGSDYA